MSEQRESVLAVLVRSVLPTPDGDRLVEVVRGESKLEAKAAFRTLYGRLHPVLIQVTESRVRGDTECAAAGVQEAFMELWVQRLKTGWNDFAHFLNWLSLIAYRKAVNECRRKYREHASGGLPEHLLTTASDDPAWVAIVREDYRRAIEAINSLPHRYRDVVIAVKIEGRSRQEVADELERPVGTIRTWLHRADALLSAALGREFAAKYGLPLPQDPPSDPTVRAREEATP